MPGFLIKNGVIKLAKKSLGSNPPADAPIDEHRLQCDDIVQPAARPEHDVPERLQHHEDVPLQQRRSICSVRSYSTTVSSQSVVLRRPSRRCSAHRRRARSNGAVTSREIFCGTKSNNALLRHARLMISIPISTHFVLLFVTIAYHDVRMGGIEHRPWEICNYKVEGGFRDESVVDHKALTRFATL